MLQIGIITQPLLNNYGGLLQNFALQKCLCRMGYSAKTVDYLKGARSLPIWRCLLSWLKTSACFLFLGKKKNFVKFSCKKKRTQWSNEFTKMWIETSPQIYRYTIKSLKDYSVVIVGSDQVWRPKYNYCIENMFLQFAKGHPIKRIAYAASFGVDKWEYTSKQTKKCSKLARNFNAISVREESGVKLCKEYLGVDATWVLDPTLLLKKNDYLLICEPVPPCNEKYLAVYLLNENEDAVAIYEKEAKKRGLVVKKFYADSKSTLSVPEWLALFRDASFVVTDSFHGTVFSIIFGKEFKCLYNKTRGSARFESLLKLYESGKLDEMRELSLNWLKNALEN